ncbi:MAG: malonyl-CoA synthase, partial [Halieaceae bacterium]
FGVPDDDFGEAVVAAVVPEASSHLDPDRMRAELAEQIAKFKVPKRIQLVEALPRNTMGKVQKNLLRDGWT